MVCQTVKCSCCVFVKKFEEGCFVCFKLMYIFVKIKHNGVKNKHVIYKCII